MKELWKKVGRNFEQNPRGSHGAGQHQSLGVTSFTVEAILSHPRAGSPMGPRRGCGRAGRAGALSHARREEPRDPAATGAAGESGAAAGDGPRRRRRAGQALGVPQKSGTGPRRGPGNARVGGRWVRIVAFLGRSGLSSKIRGSGLYHPSSPKTQQGDILSERAGQTRPIPVCPPKFRLSLPR